MANVSNGLTEKMKAFCRAYVGNGGNATEAYLTAYNTESKTTASREGSLLIQREDISDYIKALNIPLQNKVITQAISEREKKRTILWDFVNNTSLNTADRLKAMDLLNKMDSEYININRNIESTTDINNLDTEVLKALTQAE